jgi:hypothetical protein
VSIGQVSEFEVIREMRAKRIIQVIVLSAIFAVDWIDVVDLPRFDAVRALPPPANKVIWTKQPEDSRGWQLLNPETA